MTKNRWIDTVKQEAAACKTKMPWERGLRRQAMIARRVEETRSKAKVSLPPMPSFLSLDATA